MSCRAVRRASFGTQSGNEVTSSISSPRPMPALHSWDLIESFLFGLEEAVEVLSPSGVPQLA